MTILLYGEDTFRSNQKLAELKQRFRTKNQSDLNLVEIDGTKLDYEEFANAATAMGLLSELKLVIVRDFFINDPSKLLLMKIAGLLESLPKEVVVVFVESGEPKASPLLNKLSRSPHSEKFEALTGTELSDWVSACVKELGGEIEPEQIKLLLDELGSDLWLLSNELKKLVSYNPEVTSESIEKLVIDQAVPSVFDLLNAIGRRDQKAALSTLHRLIEGGESGMAILGMITKQVRDTALVKSFPEETSDQKIAAATKIHPFAVKKARQLARVLTREEIKKIFERLEATDRAIRFGEQPEVLALDLLVSQL